MKKRRNGPQVPGSVSTRSAHVGRAQQATLAALVALAALWLGGCGQKGPLTLTPKPAPQSAGQPAAHPPTGAASAPLQR